MGFSTLGLSLCWVDYTWGGSVVAFVGTFVSWITSFGTLVLFLRSFVGIVGFDYASGTGLGTEGLLAYDELQPILKEYDINFTESVVLCLYGTIFIIS